ncbi:MAG: hypothetical protein WBH77_01280 [Saccharofermentanales bacterium]
MSIDIEEYRNDWKSVLGLKQIETDISNFGYSKEFIEKNSLLKKKSQRSDDHDGIVNFFEPIEVKQIDDSVFYREVKNYHYDKIPKVFKTQFGKFKNHNNGEFPSWLGKEGYTGLPEKERETDCLLGRDDFFIEGNFCDMFDCGQFTYAISAMGDMLVANLKIVRIDKRLKATVLYENSFIGDGTFLEYHGWFKNEFGCIVVASGYTIFDNEKSKKRITKYKTTLLQINYDGNLKVAKEWEFHIPNSNSIARCGDYLYFGQNKMVTRLNINTGEFAYFTNKSDEELAALKDIW